VTLSTAEDLTMKEAIGYLRVSTREQGRSGLGLAAQRHDIEIFGAREGFAVKNWYQDIQTGAGKDALLMRPGLAAALKEARVARYPLMVSRLDRLSRNVHFISGLIEHKVHFIVAAFGKDCDNFVLHIYASLAEQERKMISERIKAAKAVAKRNGQKFGLALRSKAERRRVVALGIAAWEKAAMERAEAYRLHIEWALRQPGLYGRPIAFSAAATRLNERNIESPMGRSWCGAQLQRMARRLQLNHPTASLRRDVARARIQALWKQHPKLTGKQVIESLGLKGRHLLGIYRAGQLLKECRLAAAKSSLEHRKVGWWLDSRTSERIRIGAICKRRPEYTAKQVLKALGTGHSLPIRWVNKVMNECWRSLGSGSARQPNGWTTERRKRQAERMRQSRLWERSIGRRHPAAQNGSSGATTRYDVARMSAPSVRKSKTSTSGLRNAASKRK
jgi:DNA invertase Pin-like site-specific DNA recombinase